MPFRKHVWPRCRRCGRQRVNRPRGLCWYCYYTPGVRDRYPPLILHHHDTFAPGKLPDEPTDALPGTPAKVRVLAQRQARGEQLFHPLDAGRPA